MYAQCHVTARTYFDSPNAAPELLLLLLLLLLLNSLARAPRLCADQGWTLTGGAALTYAVASGVGATTAVGYLFATMMASLVDLTFVAGFFETMGADKTPAAVWGAIQAAVVAATLF